MSFEILYASFWLEIDFDDSDSDSTMSFEILFALFWLEIPYKFRRFHVQILLNEPLLSADLRRSGSCNFSFLKNSLVQINSKLNSKPYDYLYKSCVWLSNRDKMRFLNSVPTSTLWGILFALALTSHVGI